MIETCCDHQDLLHEYWQFLMQDSALESLQAANFSRIWSVFLQKRTGKVLEFMREWEKDSLDDATSEVRSIVDLFLKHINTSAIMDLLLKLISMEEMPDGDGVVDVTFVFMR